MPSMSKKEENNTKAKSPSLDPQDPDKENRKKAVLQKARSKFLDAVRKSKSIDKDKDKEKKSKTQSTIDYILKPCPGTQAKHQEKNQVFTNNQLKQNTQNGHNGHTGQNIGHTTLKRSTSLQKQHSLGSTQANEDEDIKGISRLRPATVCVDKIQDETRQTAALALERPSKVTFNNLPQIMGYPIHINKDSLPRKTGRKAFTPEMKRNFNNNLNNMKKAPSFDLEDLDLESQAMRIVRTVGQAFEVCHKLSINAPETEQLDYDEQETLTQDDRLSDVPSDKPKKDIISEGASDKLSLPDENSIKDNGIDINPNSTNTNNNNNNNRPSQHRYHHLDLPSLITSNASAGLSSSNNSNSHSPLHKSSLNVADTYNSSHMDGLGGSGSCSSSIPISGSAISAHHEIQLLREQLEQQGQQTHAALAQLQLAREQLAAEQSARLEAQARTHQLLVHNRELLDHIAALVAHLQGDKAGSQQQNSPHVTMPQQQQYQSNENYSPEHQEPPSLDHSVLQALGLNPQGLIENRAVTSCLPSSPLRTPFNSPGGLFNFSMAQGDFSLEAQLLQRLQSLCGYTPPQYSYNLSQGMPFMPNLYAQPMVNNNYTLQPPPQKKLPPSPLAVRHSYSGSPILDNRVSPNKNDSMQSLNFQPQNLGYQQNYSSGQNLSQYNSNPNYQSNQSLNQIPQQNSQHLQVQHVNQTRQSPQRNLSNVSPKSERGEPQFIKPLSQMGTLTTTDTEGRVRVIVPVPSTDEAAANMMSSLRMNDELRSVPTITRSTSEKVPNRSELMSQVQRTTWARHTTK